LAREWVSSGGAWRTSFPEWLAAEGRQHILQLNSEWLRSGEKHTTFNDWLVGTVTPKAAPAPLKLPDDLVSGSLAKPSAENGKWRSQDSKLVCNYELSGLPPPQTTTSLKMECSVTRYLNGTLDTYLRFYLTDGSGLGTEASPSVQGGMFEVNASANEDVPDTAILGIISSRDTMLAVRTLAIGKDLTLTLIDHETVPLSNPLRLRLNGDPNFAQLYERLQRTV
jgi:hypothetical protein